MTMQGVACTIATAGLLGVLLGCTQEAPPLPPVPNAPDDLSTWSVPELVQPPPLPEPVPIVPKDKPTAAEQVLDYTPGTTYTLTVPVNAPLDIVLSPGEMVRTMIGGDQTPVEVPQGAEQTTKGPWGIKEGMEGTGETARAHIFLTVTTPGLSTGFVILTTKRAYYLTCKSVKSTPHRVARWRYPAESVAVKPGKEPGLLPDPTEPKRWHTGYRLESSHAQPPEWLPRGVFDDGRKMYLVLPEVTLFETAPMVRMVGPNGSALVNARQFLNILVIDQLAPRLELRVGIGEHAEVVTISRGALRTIPCPESAECPVWPHAAQVLARQGGPAVRTPSPPLQAPPPQGDQP